MDIFKQGMKGPTRPAPSVPGFNVNRYSPVTNWNDDPFGADLFEPTPQGLQKKKPPPRPPPPRINKVPDVPAKPSHFIRRPTVLSSLLSRRNKSTNQTVAQTNQIISSLHSAELPSYYDNSKIFTKCETKNVQTGALIDLSSPPSSPTFTTRSSSDGLSVDSFGSDATTSTNHHNAFNGGSASQAESGFEDDFDLFLNTKKISKEDTFDDFNTIDPFSPPQNVIKSNYSKKMFNKDLPDVGKSIQMPVLKGPTIIRAKPARPKPPDNAAILKSTFGNNLPLSMSVNTTKPIQKITAFSDNFDQKPLSWDDDSSSSDREASPPMPSIPPPPPPPEVDDDLPMWPDESELNQLVENHQLVVSHEMEDVNGLVEPYAVALFNYSTGHPDDLEFMADTKIRLIRRVDNDWLFGQLKNGTQGLFPANFVEIKVPLPNENVSTPKLGLATALYDFEAVQSGDLSFKTGDMITVTHKISDEWYFGECKGKKGQFPINYVQMNL